MLAGTLEQVAWSIWSAGQTWSEESLDRQIPARLLSWLRCRMIFWMDWSHTFNYFVSLLGSSLAAR